MIGPLLGGLLRLVIALVLVIVIAVVGLLTVVTARSANVARRESAS